MFILKDNFSKCNDNLQPYSFEVEQHTYVPNLHATVHDGAFYLQSVGNRYILCAPRVSSGRLSFNFAITFLKEYDPKFTVYFGYNKNTRCGMGIRLWYELSGKLNAELITETLYCAKVIKSIHFNNFVLEEDEPIHFEMVLTENCVSCTVGENTFSFDCKCTQGHIGIERQNFIGELIISDLEFETNDKFETLEILKPLTAKIPLSNGGDIPYEITWKIDKLDEEYFLTYSLNGGTGTRAYNKSDRPYQFNVELDHMTRPYVGIYSQSAEETFNMANGEICFVDANIYWECQKDYFKDTLLPLCSVVKLDPCLFCDDKLSEDANLIFGYDNLLCKGYANQQGDREFRYDTRGLLLYEGSSLNGQNVYKVFSPPDKYALNFIPENCYKRDDVVNHIKYNHYFECKENICFNLHMYTKLNKAYITIKAEIQNVYETAVLSSADTETSEKEYIKGYFILNSKAEFPTFEVGVYKIVFKVFYGEKLIDEVKHTFEVFNEDTDEIPPLKSGLPFIFSMANEIKWLERNAFDLWNPMHSCDSVHYISCVTDTPIEAERRKTWELIKPFKRKWFAWLAPRTCKNYREADAHRETLENADYLFYAVPPKGKTARCQFTQFPLRSDHWSYITTKSGFQLDILKSFLTENPHFSEKIGYDFEKDEFSYDHYERLMLNCRLEWIKYINEHILTIIDAQNKELKAINSKVKRSMYGPLSIYITPGISYRSLPDYGLPADSRLSETVFTGFNIFEDYPIACSYPTYRGPFTVASILLHCPGAVMYPEQYREDKGGNMDGAVKYAHSPMALYAMEPYQYSTHSFEYVFNTAYRLNDGYHYWDTYGFHRRDHGPEMLDTLVKDWHYVIENKPKKPLKSMAIIAEYDEADTDIDITLNHVGEKLYAFCNQSELASGIIYECSRECGIPNGFQIKFDTLKTLSSKETDLLIVPTLKNAKEEYIQEIRRLYNEGVNLIGLSDISGLEDLFGVCCQKHEHDVSTIFYGNKSETIYPTKAVFNYRATSSKPVVFLDNNTPAVFKTSRTALINTKVLSLGCENKGQRDNRPNAYCVIGELIRRALSDIITDLSKPLARGENVGITLFEAQAGHRELVAINYLPHDNHEQYTPDATVKFNFKPQSAIIGFDMPDLLDVQSDKELFICKENGIIKEIRFDIKPHETAFIKLITKK